MKLKSILISIFYFFPALLFAENFVGFRVIRTSPEEFLKLHRMNFNRNDYGSGESPSSRLTRFVKIQNKTVRQNVVKYEVKPDFPILKEYFEGIKSMNFVVTESAKSNNAYDLNVIVEAPQFQKVNARIEVEKHEQGALLKFFITDSDYSKVSLDIFIGAIRAFKFARETADQAAKDTMLFDKVDKNGVFNKTQL